MGLRTSIVVELTEREDRFLAALARGVKPTAAAILAGYGGTAAARLIHRPHVEGCIRQAAANLAKVIDRIDREKAEMATAGVGEADEADE